MPVETWFKEKWRDDVATRLKAKGGVLDGTMTTGSNVAGYVKFPVVGGRIVMHKLSGAIEEVRPQGVNIEEVTLQASDYTAEATFRNQDQSRMSASLQSALGEAMATGVRVKRDSIKLDALNVFCNLGATGAAYSNGAGYVDAPSTPTTLGDGTGRVDILQISTALAQMRGAGGTDESYWPIPAMWFEQLCWYKEFASKDYTGDPELAKGYAVQMKTFRGVHIMEIPDEHFVYGTGAYVPGQSGWDATKYLDTFMWTKAAIGCETFWSKENADINEWIGKAGKPFLMDTALSGAAIGLMPEGIKRIRFKAINDTVRPT